MSSGVCTEHVRSRCLLGIASKMGKIEIKKRIIAIMVIKRKFIGKRDRMAEIRSGFIYYQQF